MFERNAYGSNRISFHPGSNRGERNGAISVVDQQDLLSFYAERFPFRSSMREGEGHEN